MKHKQDTHLHEPRLMVCLIQDCYLSLKESGASREQNMVVQCKVWGQEETITMLPLIDAMRIIYQFLSINFLNIWNKTIACLSCLFSGRVCVTAPSCASASWDIAWSNCSLTGLVLLPPHSEMYSWEGSWLRVNCHLHGGGCKHCAREEGTVQV